MAFVPAAALAEVPPGRAKRVVLGGKKVGLFNVEGTLYALHDTGPHRGASQCEGEVQGHFVTGPWHDASFDPTTGAHLSPPAKKGVAVYPVQVAGDAIQVDLG